MALTEAQAEVVERLRTREGETHAEWCHRNGMMTYDEAVWTHRIEDTFKWLLAIVLLLVMLPVAAHVLGPLIAWYMSLFPSGGP